MKLIATVKPEDVQNTSGGVQFVPTRPAFYDAIVEKLTVDTFEGGYKQLKNPDSDNGKFTYVKVAPHMTLINEHGTRIDREEFIIGAWSPEKNFYRPDGDTNKSVIGEAFYLLRALNMFTETGELNADTDSIVNRVIRVKTAIAGYRKAARENYAPKDILTMLKDANGGVFSYDDIPENEFTQTLAELTRKWDTAYGDTADPLKLKNVIVGFFTVSDSTASEYYTDDATGDVYESEDAFFASQIQTDDIL